MTDKYNPLTNEEIYRLKAEQRKVFAKAPIEAKLQDLIRMQRMNYVMKKAVGRKAPQPWHTSDDHIEQHK